MKKRRWRERDKYEREYGRTKVMMGERWLENLKRKKEKEIF